MSEVERSKWNSQRSTESAIGPGQGTSMKCANSWASRDTTATSSKGIHRSPNLYSTLPSKRHRGTGTTKSKGHSKPSETKWSVNQSCSNLTSTKPSTSKPTHPSMG